MQIKMNDGKAIILDLNDYQIENLEILKNCIIFYNHNWSNFEINDEVWLNGVEYQYLLQVIKIENNIATVQIINMD